MIYKLKKFFDNIKENVYNTNCLKYMEVSMHDNYRANKNFMC